MFCFSWSRKRTRSLQESYNTNVFIRSPWRTEPVSRSLSVLDPHRVDPRHRPGMVDLIPRPIDLIHRHQATADLIPRGHEVTGLSLPGTGPSLHGTSQGHILQAETTGLIRLNRETHLSQVGIYFDSSYTYVASLCLGFYLQSIG